jgi:hypothetical protein
MLKARTTCVDCGDSFPASPFRKLCEACKAQRNRERNKADYYRLGKKSLERYHINKGTNKGQEARIQRNNRRLERKLKALEVYGPNCVCCGESNYKFLTFHHSMKDGAKHREEIAGGSDRSGHAFVYALHRLGYPDVPGLCVLCANCHLATDLWGGCPHQDK